MRVTKLLWESPRDGPSLACHSCGDGDFSLYRRTCRVLQHCTNQMIDSGDAAGYSTYGTLGPYHSSSLSRGEGNLSSSSLLSFARASNDRKNRRHGPANSGSFSSLLNNSMPADRVATAKSGINFFIGVRTVEPIDKLERLQDKQGCIGNLQRNRARSRCRPCQAKSRRSRMQCMQLYTSRSSSM